MPDMEIRLKHDGADIDFRRGLEELVQGHIDGCMTSLDSYNSLRTTDDEDDGGADQLARRRRRSDLDGDDLAESSAAARRQSRILGWWVARQAEEMITTIERRNRESELMALAGLHTVSMLDSSFLQDSSRAQASVEPPVAARASSILQQWRELEVEAAARDRISTRRGTAAAASQNASEGRASESDDIEFSQWADNPFGLANRREDMEGEDEDGRSTREPSPDLGDVERERVRQIVRGWMNESGIADDSSRMSQRNHGLRGEWLGETERERVRLVREWVHMASQHRDVRGSMREERERDGSVTDHEDGQPEHIRRDPLRFRGRQARLDLIMRIVRERQRELQGLSEHRAVSEFAHRSRIQSFLRGRFLRNERSEEYEGPPSLAARELGLLRQHHPVSSLREGFRFRLENIVRGQASIQAEASVRNDANFSTYRHAVNEQQPVASTDPEDNNQGHSPSTSESDETNQTAETELMSVGVSISLSNNVEMQQLMNQGVNLQEEAEHRAVDWQPSAEVRFSEWPDENVEESDGNMQEHMDQEWSRETHDDDGGHALGAHEDWQVGQSHETVENLEDGPSVSPRDQQSIQMRRVNRFIPADDDTVYSVELRELLSRRSVSSLLHSGFRESLDQLIRSYVQRQGGDPLNWDVQNPLSSPPEGDQGSQVTDPNEELQGSVARPPLVLPSPPVPPPQPMWHSRLHHNSWTRPILRRSEIEWDIINDLRSDMSRLRQGMNHMQRMLEACMDMQLELQRSVRQEVSAALNRYSGEQAMCEEPQDYTCKFSHVKNGTCCVCCDSHIDSLLYRCGHMCTCSKCAVELLRGGGKCPLCRAPIVEVIRAYSIL